MSKRRLQGIPRPIRHGWRWLSASGRPRRTRRRATLRASILRDGEVYESITKVLADWLPEARQGLLRQFEKVSAAKAGYASQQEAPQRPDDDVLSTNKL